MAATDPANHMRELVPWPQADDPGAPEAAVARGATRTAGALVVLADGRAAA